MRALASGQASPRVVISALQAVAITILWTTQSSWRNLLAWSTASTARAISPTYGFHKPQKPCLLSPDASTVISTASGAPDVHTISDLQQALKMLGYRITVDGNYGPETRQVVTSFQMHAGILADGIAGSQTLAKLLTELSRSGRHCAEPLSPRT
jgi:N-acetyl-anhydromuramyl-L-alanine amidase AmpD